MFAAILAIIIFSLGVLVTRGLSVLSREHTPTTPHWSWHSVVTGDQQARVCK